MAKEIFIVNTVFASNSGRPTAVACRIRGEVNGKTIKVSPHLFGSHIPLAGEAVFAEYNQDEMEDTGNYRVLRNGKMILATSSAPAPTAEEAMTDAVFAALAAHPAAPPEAEEIPAF